MQKTENIESLQPDFPDIEKKFQNGFPNGWRPWILGWAFKPEELIETLPDGTYKILTLDVSINPDDYIKKVNEGLAKDFLSEDEKQELNKRAETYYNCEIGCKRCFECKTNLDNPLMSAEEMLEVVKQAKNLGLKSIKFLGPGELVHNQKLFEILDFCENNEIELIIFTKGIIFGDNELSQKIHSLSPEDLAEKISKYKYISLVVGFAAFSKEIEEKRIGSKISNFTEKRNRGLENLAKAGMNDNLEQSRLFLITNPVLKDNIDEIMPIYKYGIERNMPVILGPTMIAGKGKEAKEIHDEFFKQEQLVDLYVKVYIYLIDSKIFTLEQVEKEGITPYGGVPCTQFISGMFIRRDGRVQACPGNESEPYRYSKDVRKEDLKNIWKNNLGYKLRKELVENGKDLTTQICYAKTEGDLVQIGSGSIPQNFYKKVLERIKKHYEKN